MSNSLQEQLVQAGLADEESLNKSREGGRKRGRGRKKGGGRHKSDPAKKGASASRAETADTRAGNTAPEQAQPRREPTAEEKADRVRQMIRANRIDRTYAAVPYRFTEDSRIREIAVTGSQQARIARGELAVVTDGERCELVPAKVARRIRGSDPRAVLVLNAEGERPASDDDDPYADYPVPDDLMW